MNEAAEPRKQRRDRHHAKHHHRVAQFARQALDFLRHRAQRDIGAGARQLAEARLGDNELADAVHQFIETLGRNANVFGGLRLALVGLCGGLALGGNRLDGLELGCGENCRRSRDERCDNWLSLDL